MNISRFNRAGFLVASAHFLAVVFLAIYIFYKGGDFIYLWIVFVILDFPISLGLYLFSFLKLDYETVNSIDSLFYWGAYSDFSDVVLPAIYLGSLGSFWWYKIISLVFNKRIK